MSAQAPRLFIRREARTDLEKAFAWYEERSAGLGHEFMRAVRVQLAAIERHPPQSTALAVPPLRESGSAGY